MQQLSKEFADSTWQHLRQIFQTILENPQQNWVFSFEEVYRRGYDMVLHDFGGLLYSGVMELIHKHLTAVNKQCGAHDAAQLCHHLGKAWQCYKTSLIEIKHTLLYMERNYVPLHRKTPVYTAGRTCFQQIMLNTGTVRMKLSESIAERFRPRDSQGKQLNDRFVQLIVCGVFPMLELADVFSLWCVACGKSKVSV